MLKGVDPLLSGELLAILDDELGAYKPPTEPTLEPMDPAPAPATISAFDG